MMAITIKYNRLLKSNRIHSIAWKIVIYCNQLRLPHDWSQRPQTAKLRAILSQIKVTDIAL
jgi:hypothetical protein